MSLIKLTITILVWLVIGVLVAWNGAGWVLGRTSIEFLQDDAVKLIIQIVAVMIGTPTITGIGYMITLGILMLFED